MPPDEADNDYLLDTTYPDRFHPELAPSWLHYVGVHGGAPLRHLKEPFTYLDLGCGFGHSAILNAAAYPHAEFHACDFNPEHIAAAREHAGELGTDNLHLHQARFEELLTRDLPQFDYVVLQGIYTWVSPEVRATITRLLASLVKPGGLVYASYNCHPGWSAETPLRKLMSELAASLSGTSEQRAQAALLQLQKFAQPALRYFRDTPSALTTIKELTKSPPNYLAHEYLNANWTVFFSVDIADEMARAGLQFLGSATLPDNHLPLVVDRDTAAEISALALPRLQQLAKDFARNQRFRRDVFIQGQPAARTPEQTLAALDQLMVGCSGDLADVSTEIIIPRGKLRFQPQFVNDLRALLQRGPLSVGQIAAELGTRTQNAMELRQNLFFMVASGALTPAAQKIPAPSSSQARSAPRAARRALGRISSRQTPGFVPSEALGTGVRVTAAEAVVVEKWLVGTKNAQLPERFRHLGIVTLDRD